MLCSHVTRLVGLISETDFCNQFVTVKLTFIWLYLSDWAWFHLHGYFCSQNNLYSEFNPRNSSSWCNFNLFKRYWQCVRIQGHHFQHLLKKGSWFYCFYRAILELYRENLVALGESHALLAGSREVTGAFNFVSGRTVVKNMGGRDHFGI
jgi:hypothetical protein